MLMMNTELYVDGNGKRDLSLTALSTWSRRRGEKRTDATDAHSFNKVGHIVGDLLGLI
jgi:hypothetical protein